MPKFQNLTGLVFGRLTVSRLASRGGRGTGGCMWECTCDCGKKGTYYGGALRSGNTRSCGCLKAEVIVSANIIHGGCDDPEYKAWHGMRQRCTNPKSQDWKNYGARGITVTDRWRSYENFKADMGSKPSPKHSIERRDNDLGYTPENCYWGTRIDQANNQRTNHRITWAGRTQTIAQWAREIGVSHDVLWQRLKHGWSVQKAITTPLQKPVATRKKALV